jgi:DNA-binding NtrC family response regulator
LKIVFEDDFELEFAASGEEALMKYHRHIPQVVLMDYKMPGINGLETLERMQAQVKPSPVILMSAYNDKPMVHAAMEYGAKEFISKPFDIDSIRAAIERAVEEPKPLSPTEANRAIRNENKRPAIMTQNEVDELVDQTMRFTCLQ